MYDETYEFTSWDAEMIITKSERNYEMLLKFFERLNKKAAKLGVPPIVIEEIERFDKEIVKYPTDLYPGYMGDRIIIVPMVSFKVHGEMPVWNGWNFVSKIEFDKDAEGNILPLTNTAPGEELPEEFWTSDNKCEHCKHKRARRWNYVVKKKVSELSDNEKKDLGCQI